MTSPSARTDQGATAPAGRRSWLDDAPDALALPTRGPRPTVLAAPVSSVEVPLTPAQATALETVAGRTGADEATVLLTVFRVLLSRITDETDLVVGYGDREHARDDTVLVVRAAVDLDGGMDVAVATTAAALAEARERGASTVQHLVAELGLEPGQGKHPVFQVGFAAWQDARQGSWPPSSTVPLDLLLSCRRDVGAVSVTLHHVPALFERQWVERLAGHLTRLLVESAADPSVPVGVLPLLCAQDIAELEGWSAATHEHDSTAALAARFWDQAAATPDAPAVEHGDTVVSYHELCARAAALGRALVSVGVDSDVTVAVCAERSVDMVVGVLGAVMAGGVYVPVDPAYPADRRDFMIGDSGARVLLTTSRTLSVVPASFDGEVVLLDDQGTPPEPDDDAGRLRGRSGRDLGYVIYTSGSTGQPKAVAMPQSALTNLLDWQLRRPQFVRSARTLQFSSLSFDVSFQEIFSTWASGGTLVLIDDATRRDPLRLLDHLTTHRVERLFLPYVALRGLASAVAATGRVPHTLREVYTAGEQLQVDPVLRSLFERLPGSVLENQYGPSESHVVTASTLAADVQGWPALPPIGRPIDNAQVHVLDSRRQRRPVGVPGELYLGGACLARGYLGRPDLTEERFVPAPSWTATAGVLYRTGDLARWLPTGEVEFLGRLDHQVKFRGYRIEPGEVGAVLSAAPGVEQCVALVRSGEAGPRLTAYLVPRTGSEPELAGVHRFAKEHLPGHMVPSHYLIVPVLPLTSSGKIDTAALPDAPFDRSILATAHRSPRSREEHVLADIWSTLLGVPDIGMDDDFFELGGDSLLAAEMAQRVADALGREMPLGALAQAPTIAGLAALLDEGNEGEIWRTLVPLAPGREGVTPLFLVHGGSGNVATFPKLARVLDGDQPVFALQWDGFGSRRGQRSVAAMARHYLTEVRSVQPQGPYLLGGQCIGGLVAREMTRRLLAEGEQVALLVMYDSPHLGSEAYVPKPSAGERLRSSAGRRRLAFEAARGVYRRRPRRDPVDRSSEAMRRAAWRHRPGSVPASVPTHFVGSGEWRGEMLALDGQWTDGAMGWASYASPAFTVHRLEGDHNEVLYDPAAVEVLRTALTRAHADIAAAREGRRSAAGAGG